jgi:hypothetical protein
MLRRGRRSVALLSERIAPGLYRLVPDPQQRLAGSYDIDGIAGAPALVFGRPGRPAVPTAPALERVERYFVASAEGERTEVRAHFAFPIPEDIVAIVSYWGEDAEPDAFARALPSSRSSVIFATPSRCAALPEGASAPPDGAQMRVAFVDRFAQLSRPSEPRAPE